MSKVKNTNPNIALITPSVHRSTIRQLLYKDLMLQYAFSHNGQFPEVDRIDLDPTNPCEENQLIVIHTDND